MFSRVIVSSVLLAALANGLVFKRDDGYDSSTPLSVPTVTPQPISLPEPSFSLSLPPLDSSSTGTPSPTLPLSSSLPSVVTTTVYVYPTHCSPAPSGSPLPTAGPSGVPGGSTSLPEDDSITFPSPAEPTPIALPDPQDTPLKLPPVRRDDSVVTQLRDLQQQVVNTWVNLGKGDEMLPVIGQLESIIAQAAAPGADGPALLKKAQDLVFFN